jgi:nucleotide-binding universal stress UspA family protein
MYRHILIPTDGSELAEHGVTNGLSLAKSVGAKVTAIIVEEPFDWLSAQKRKGSGHLMSSPNIPSRSRSTLRTC